MKNICHISIAEANFWGKKLMCHGKKTFPNYKNFHFKHEPLQTLRHRTGILCVAPVLP